MPGGGGGGGGGATSCEPSYVRFRATSEAAGGRASGGCAPGVCGNNCTAGSWLSSVAVDTVGCCTRRRQPPPESIWLCIG